MLKEVTAETTVDVMLNIFSYNSRCFESGVMSHSVVDNADLTLSRFC